MIKRVKITNNRNETLVMDMTRPDLSGFIIRSIEGLEPPTANISTTSLAISDGAKFNSSRMESRNIVFDLVYYNQFDAEVLRHLTYKYFPVKRAVRMSFETESRECEIIGYVESNEINIFSEEEASQISVICPDPFFYKKDTVLTEFMGVSSDFEFPFEVDGGIEFGTITDVIQKNVIYTGDDEVGVVMTMHATGDVSNVTIYKMDTREAIKVNTDVLRALTGKGFSAGDDITISTVRGDKYVILFRDGVYHNILNCMDTSSRGLRLSKGDNVFACIVESGQENLQFKMEHRVLYEGL